MKSLLTLAIVLASTSAFATRSRVTALQGAAHIVDSSTVSAKPADMFAVSDSVTIETGATNITPGTSATTEGAEALLIRSAGDAKWALSLGHDDSKVYNQRAEAATAAGVTIPGQQNPFEISYGMKSGDMAWAATLGYSNFNDKKAEVKENTMGLKFGAATSTWDATIDLGLANKVTSGTAASEEEFKGKSNVAVRGGYWLASDMYVYGDVDMGGYELSTGGNSVAEVKTTDITVGAINTVKSEGNEFFWGAGLTSTQWKDSKAVTPNTEKKSSLSLPLIVGIEANAASWLTLRGSVTQNVLIQNEKEEEPASTTVEKSPGTNSTTFAAGAGLKLGKLVLDGSILSNGSQNLNTGNGGLLGTVGLTYAF